VRTLIVQVCCSLVLLMMPRSVAGHAKGLQETSRSPREFVDEFYKWYAPRALSDNTPPTWDSALKFKSSDSSPQIVRLLKEDSAAQAKCKELVGLDFDPFLNTQEPAEQYEVGTISQKGQDFKAEIYGMHSGKRNEKPDVVAEFLQKDGHWFFVNFYYSSAGTDLITMLRSPRPGCSMPRVPTKK